MKMEHAYATQAAYSGGGTGIWTPEIFAASKVLSIFQAVRFHFVAQVGSVIYLLLWPRLSGWKSREDFRIGLFLLILFWGLLYMHAVAAIGQDYCVFCFTPYIAFFNVAGILLVVVSVKSWNWRPSVFIQTLLIAGLLVVFTHTGGENLPSTSWQ